MSKLIKTLFSSLQDEMLVKLKQAQVMSHPGDKGNSTELDWLNWFEQYLPKRYSVTKGKVVDSCGNESDQIDIIIYDRQYSPLVFSYNGVNYITAESVYAVFEVKQELNKEYIEYAGKKAESVRRLVRTSAPIVYSTGLKPSKPLHKIFAGLLTTKTSWVEVDKNLKNNLVGLTNNQELDVICSLDEISCSVQYKRTEINFLGKSSGEMVTVQIDRNKERDILMHLFLTVLTKLQIIGTVPAIEFDKYFSDVASLEEMYNASKE